MTKFRTKIHLSSNLDLFKHQIPWMNKLEEKGITQQVKKLHQTPSKCQDLELTPSTSQPLRTKKSLLTLLLNHLKPFFQIKILRNDLASMTHPLLNLEAQLLNLNKNQNWSIKILIKHRKSKFWQEFWVLMSWAQASQRKMKIQLLLSHIWVDLEVKWMLLTQFLASAQ